jgi:putative oxidoreductase
MTPVDVAIVLLRMVVGLTMAAHGYNHLWGGGGLTGTTRWFDSLGLRPPKLHAVLSGAGELAAGSALVIGLCTVVAAAFVVGVMVIAAVTVHRPNGFFIFKDGYEYVLMIGVVCAAIGLLGPGEASVDRLIGIGVSGPVGLVIVVGLGVLGAMVLLAATWRPARSSGG